MIDWTKPMEFKDSGTKVYHTKVPEVGDDLRLIWWKPRSRKRLCAVVDCDGKDENGAYYALRNSPEPAKESWVNVYLSEEGFPSMGIHHPTRNKAFRGAIGTKDRIGLLHLKYENGELTVEMQQIKETENET